MKRLRATVLACLVIVSGAWGGTVTGFVFLDENNDGVHQDGETPAVGTVVSDGQTLARPDARGRYRLVAADGARVVFVVNPPGAWPRGAFHRRVTVAADGPATADFPLRRDQQDFPLYFVQGTDLHIRADVGEQMKRYVDAVNSLPFPIRFVVHTGDLVRDACAQPLDESRRLFETYLDMVAGLKPPRFDVAGNHEHAGVWNETVKETDPGYGKAMYQEYCGPMNYAFRYASHHFIAIDGSVIRDGTIVYEVGPGALQWLGLYLQEVPTADPLVLLIHEPLFSIANREQVFELLEGRQVKFILSGHAHSVTRSEHHGTTELVGGAVSYAWHLNEHGPNPLAYKLVRMTEDGFDDMQLDWAERYSTTLTSPNRRAALSGTVPLSGYFFDPLGAVSEVTVALGDFATEVTEFGEEGLRRTFEAAVDTKQAPDGFREVTVTYSGDGETEVERQVFLVMNDNEEAGVFSVRVDETAASAEVRINGHLVGTIPAGIAKRRTVVRFPVSWEHLRALNRITVRSGKGDDGQSGLVLFDDPRLTVGRRSYRDLRYLPNLDWRLQGAEDQPGELELWIDLTAEQQ